MDFRVRVFDFEQGQNEVVLNQGQAEALDVRLSDRVRLAFGKRQALAIVDHSEKLIKHGEIGVFQETAEELGVKDGALLRLLPADRPASLDYIRKKLDGEILSAKEIEVIIRDLMSQSLSNAELAAFISAVYTRGMTVEEVVALTHAIYSSGDTLNFRNGFVASEHSVGGIAGDRVSMLIVAILASLNVYIPKTSSRAISSASGTADVMEVFCPVSLSVNQMRKVVSKAHGCLVWGGGATIASADDKLIKIRNPLRLDPQPLLLSSILAKKKAEGANVVLLDLPVGSGSKLGSMEAARALAKEFTALGAKLDMKVECIVTDGSEPLLSTIGPVLEARTVLETLRGKGEPALAEKACVMSGLMLSIIKGYSKEEGYRVARHQLESGKALAKFLEIVKLQGGNPGVKPEDLKPAKHALTINSKENAKVAHVDNKAVFRVCRALGAPQDPGAGIVLHAMKGKSVKQGDPLFTMYSSSKDRFITAKEATAKMFEFEKVIIEVL